jgi:hypothetical protein
MEQLNLQRIRDLIIAAHSVSGDGTLTFDTTAATSLGFTEAEIDEANQILAAEQVQQLQDYFRSKINFYFLKDSPCIVYYIGYAKLIFAIHPEKDGYSYVTEEELELMVNEIKDMLVKMEYIYANSKNDASGNPI